MIYEWEEYGEPRDLGNEGSFGTSSKWCEIYVFSWRTDCLMTVCQNLPAQQLQQEVQSRLYFGVFAFHQHSEQETIVFLVVS